MYLSITPSQISDHKRDWPGDSYIIRQVNGDNEQHWAVCDAKTWNIVSLSYTKEEAVHILAIFRRKEQ